MRKNLTELVIILDKSGSMSGLENDVVGGFNSLIKEQKKAEGQVLVTVVMFDTHYDVIYKRTPLSKIINLTINDYVPSGCTALLDTVGNAIAYIQREHTKLDEGNVPEHTIFSIMTDGLENSSKEYSYKQIKNMIENKKKDGWEFIFQAANIDAHEEGDRLGISKEDIVEFCASREGVGKCFKQMSCFIEKKRTHE